LQDQQVTFSGLKSINHNKRKWASAKGLPMIRILTVILICLTASVGCNRSNNASSEKAIAENQDGVTEKLIGVWRSSI
jgi:hypothetical protein